MCLAFLSDRYFPIDLLNETIILSVGENGTLTAKEVYDVFIQPQFNWQHTRLLCISPHVLLNEKGVLEVTARDAPGSGATTHLEDQAYKGISRRPLSGTAWNAGWEPGKGEFWAELIWGTRDDVEEIRREGKTVLPAAAIPERVRRQNRSSLLMENMGTIFELTFPEGLTSGQRYMFRLEVTPHKLLNVADPRPKDDPWLRFMDIPIGYLTQDLSIFAPSTCVFNVREMLKDVQSLRDYAETAGALQATISDSVTLLPLALHRLVVVCPHRAEVLRHHLEGWTSHTGSFALTPRGTGEIQKQVAHEWIAGAKTYWVDDPGAMARKVWDQLHGWGPKTKEELTASLQGEVQPHHHKVSLVVSVLHRLGALNEVFVPGKLGDRVEYRATDLRPAELDRRIEELVKDPDITDGFVPRGFEISYSVSYPYLSTAEQKKLRHVTCRQRYAFPLAVVSTTLSLLGLCVGIVALVLFLLS